MSSFGQSGGGGGPLLPGPETMELVRATMDFMTTLNKILEGDDTVPGDLEIVLTEKKTLEDKFKSAINDPRRTQPASAASLAELQRLQAEVETKNAVLDSLLIGLKAFELDLSLRRGGVVKQHILKEKYRELKSNEAAASNTVMAGDSKRIHVEQET